MASVVSRSLGQVVRARDGEPLARVLSEIIKSWEVLKCAAAGSDVNWASCGALLFQVFSRLCHQVSAFLKELRMAAVKCSWVDSFLMKS